MPKIIKNGKEYSGVPIEVVTAWAPTADPVQVKEPLMGNTDISDIGDGTVTGAIDTINDGLSSKITYIQTNQSVTVPASGNVWVTPPTPAAVGYTGYTSYLMNVLTGTGSVRVNDQNASNCRLANNGASEITTTVTFGWLCVKNT